MLVVNLTDFRLHRLIEKQEFLMIIKLVYIYSSFLSVLIAATNELTRSLGRKEIFSTEASSVSVLDAFANS